MYPERRLGHVLHLAACWLLGLAACAAPPVVPTLAPTPTPTLVPTLVPTAAAAQGRISKLFDIGGRRLFLQCEGAGSPTVVLEAGLGENLRTWQYVTSALSEQTRVCAYDRAGLGSSDPPAVRPRTSQDIAFDLHKLLAAAGEIGPYVLVGHSIGGFHVRVFAADFPDEVVGLVLVDSSHPDQMQAFLDSLPPAAPDEPEEWKAYRAQLDSILNDPSSNPEAMDVAASAAQVRASGDLGDISLVVVTANQDAGPSATEFQADLFARLSPVWLRLQADLVGLSSKGTQVFATRGGHFVPSDDPEVVVEAIKGVVQAARK